MRRLVMLTILMSLIGFVGCGDESMNSNASDVSQEGEITPGIKEDDSP